MKRSLQLALLLCPLLMLGKANAAESEPNNTAAQANTLALNGSNSGKIALSGDQDWWKVTTTADGKLSVTLTPLSGRHTWVYLYDNDGVAQLAANYSTAAFTITRDDLAAGTYYLKVICFYSTDSSSYNLSNNLTQPAQANDVEPNDRFSQAKTLPLNGNRTGHVGYYYNNRRDTADWWKVTTTADGKLDFTLTPTSGKYVWVYLYDADGTTLLASTYSTTAFTLSKDGLAAGNYYVRVNCYYNSDYAPYTLANTLTLPAQANDAEPNNNRAQAITLAPNSTTTGHTGYYNNNSRDSADWYKITTTQDGMLKLSLTPGISEYVWIYLYDNNGTTLLESSYSTANFTITKDGLAAGTYYVRINCYYNDDFAPYTFTDSLITYNNNADQENNNRAYLAKTLNANVANPGHVGFYYNNVRDTFDWYKVNYTGPNNGTMTVGANFETRKAGGFDYIYMTIYKDTLAAPLYNEYTASPSLVANLTNLTQGYYWVRVKGYYGYGYSSYAITPTFTQNNVASVSLVNATPVNSCNETNSIRLQCSGSRAPYKVQLYRFGVLYSTTTVANTSAFDITGLPTGYYTARAYGDGATGNAYGTSGAAQLEPTPTGLSSSNVRSTQARVSWTGYDGCVLGYRLQYRATGTPTWITKYLFNTTTNITGLTPSTPYEWRVASGDSANSFIAFSANATASFTTTASFAGSISAADENDIAVANNNALNIFPNPATTQFTVQFNALKATGTVSLWLKNINGAVVWNKNNIAATAAKGTVVDVSRLPSGIYMLHITDQNNKTIAVKKVVVSK